MPIAVSRNQLGSVAVAGMLWLVAGAASVKFGTEEEFSAASAAAFFQTDSINAALIATNPQAITIDADGLASRDVGVINYQGDHTWSGVIHVTQDFITFRDGTITARADGVPQGITFQGKRKRITFENLTFNGVGDGLTVGNDQSVDDVTIDNCRFLDCRSPNAKSHDVLLGGRGYGVFASAGKNWTIRDSVFQTRSGSNVDENDAVDRASQYAARLGSIYGLNVKSTRFENHGKACVWLMFVHAAVFDDVEFVGGPIRIGARPNDMPGVDTGDCKNIIFRNCRFQFGSHENWPAGILIFPGVESVTFENCQITTVSDSTWWLEVDERDTRNIQWKNITWNGRPVEGYLGVRSSMSIDAMRAKGVGPITDTAPIR